jgi:hypothetical protein
MTANLCAAAVVSAAILVPFCSAQDVPSLSSLGEIIQNQERSVGYVSGKCHASYMRRGSDTAYQESILAFVLEGEVGGRMWMEFDRMDVLGKNGQVAQSIQATWGYNGVVTWMHKRSVTDRSKGGAPVVFPRAEGTVAFERSSMMSSESGAAWSATLPGFYSARGETFSGAMKRCDAPFQIEPHEMGLSLSCVSRGGVRDVWVLKKDWGYCLAAYTRSDSSGRRMRAIVVDDAKQVHESFWYPTSVRFLGKDLDADWMCTKVEEVLQTKEMPPEVFDPVFPRGAQVQDLSNGAVVNLSGPEQALQRLLSEQAAQIRGWSASGVGRTFDWLLWVGIAVAVAVLWLCFRKRRSSKAVATHGSRGEAGLGLLVLAMLPLSPATGQSLTMLDVLPNQRADNCGLNVTLLACAVYGIECDLRGAARALSCEPKGQRSVSLDRIAGDLRDQGLGVSPFQNASLDQVLEHCRVRRAVAVIHCMPATGEGHYYLVATSERGCVVANPGLGTWLLPRSDPFVEKLATHFSGNGALITQAGQSLGWLLSRGEWESNGGTVEGAQVTWEIPVVNDLGREVRLDSVMAGCGCVGVSLVPARLGAAEKGALVVKFNATSLPGGKARQDIRLGFNTGTQAVERALGVTIEVERPSATVKAHARPSRVVASAGESGNFQGDVVILVPDGGRIEGWKPGGTCGVIAGPMAVEGVAGRGIRTTLGSPKRDR